MLITDKFIFVHLPKTGGLFVDRVLKDMLCPSRFMQGVHALRHRYGVTIPGVPYRYVLGPRHGSCAAIPEAYRGLPILACRRNPFDWYVSDYCYGVWRQATNIGKFWSADADPRERYPSWPELDFAGYVDATTTCATRVVHAKRRSKLAGTLGVVTLEFLRMFCRDRHFVFAANSDEEMYQRIEETLYPVRFLEMTNLNRDLHAYLLERGFPEEQAGQVLERGRINASARADTRKKDWRDYYNPETLETVRYRERMLLLLFPEYDVPTGSGTAEGAEAAVGDTE